MLRQNRIMMAVLGLFLCSLPVLAQTTQESGVRDTAALDTLARAAEAAQGQSQMQPPATNASTAWVSPSDARAPTMAMVGRSSLFGRDASRA